MISENLSTLKIHKLTQEQYDRELAEGNLDPTALYLTPDNGADLEGVLIVDKTDAEIGDGFIKPQNPLKSGEDNVYPLTTYDQIVMPDGEKWDGTTSGDINLDGVLTIDLEDTNQGEATLIDSDLLGGKPAEYYLAATATALNSEALGGVAANEYALKTDTAPDASLFGGKAPKYYIQPRNLLDNSWWKVQKEIVNQRGQAEYTSNGYTIDRWEIYAGAVGVSTNGYITTSGQMYQKIDIPTDKVYTFAIENDAGIVVVTGIPANGIHSATLGNALIKLATIGEYVEVVIEPSEGYDIAGAYWAALYEGEYTVDNLPPYVPKGYAAELAECSRWYTQGTYQTARPYATGSNTAAYLCDVKYPVPMEVEHLPAKQPTVNIRNIKIWASQADAGIGAAKNVGDNTGFNSINLSSGLNDAIIQFDYYASADL